MEDKALDKIQYVDLAVDIHHVFPQKWCNENGIDDEHRESIVNKTTISARTNRTIGGPRLSYLEVIETGPDRPGSPGRAPRTHLVPPHNCGPTTSSGYFSRARESLCQLVEKAIGKTVQRDIDEGPPRRTPLSSSQSTRAPVTGLCSCTSRLPLRKVWQF